MIGKWTADWATKNSIACTYQSEINSTNDFAKENFSKLKMPHILVCDKQSAGRGRASNSWQAVEPGLALYTTLCLKSRLAYTGINSPRIGLCLYKSLKQNFSEKTFSLKAPNDIYCGNKKVAGILLEGVQSDWHYLFVGIGINVMAHPISENACHLDDKLTIAHWQSFLASFWQNLNDLDLSAQELQTAECEDLVKALKSYDQKIQNISTKGDIIYPDHKLSWLDL